MQKMFKLIYPLYAYYLMQVYFVDALANPASKPQQYLILPIALMLFIPYFLFHLFFYFLKVNFPENHHIKNYYDKMYQKLERANNAKKKCVIYISPFDHNGYIDSLLAVSFIHKLCKKIQKHYQIEICTNNLHSTNREPDLLIIYSHNANCNLNFKSKQTVHWGCYSSQKKTDDSKQHDFFSDDIVYPGGDIQLNQSGIINSVSFCTLT